MYRMRLRMWLNKGDAIQWPSPWGPIDTAGLEDEGRTIVTDVYVNRGALMNGLFYGVDGMRIGGTRKLNISPHLGYGERGVPGVIPPNSVLICEVTVLEERLFNVSAEASP
jgi:hypothetical protein